MYSDGRIYNDYLNDILEEINNIEKFVNDLAYEEFLKDTKTVYAVIRSFEIIGEAVKSIPSDIKDKYNYVPWKKMTGMRNKLIHHYFGIDYETVWETVKRRIPELKESIITLLKDFGEK